MRGSTSIPASGNGTLELSVTYSSPEVYVIALDTASYTLTAPTTYSLRDSLGYLNPPLLRSALKQLLSSAEACPGVTFSFKYTIPSSFKSRGTEILHQLFEQFAALSSVLSRMKTP
jgi:hypothetical protein